MDWKQAGKRVWVCHWQNLGHPNSAGRNSHKFLPVYGQNMPQILDVFGPHFERQSDHFDGLIQIPQLFGW
jgi:hypothetical protein